MSSSTVGGGGSLRDSSRSGLSRWRGGPLSGTLTPSARKPKTPTPRGGSTVRSRCSGWTRSPTWTYRERAVWRSSAHRSPTAEARCRPCGVGPTSWTRSSYGLRPMDTASSGGHRSSRRMLTCCRGWLAGHRRARRPRRCPVGTQRCLARPGSVALPCSPTHELWPDHFPARADRTASPTCLQRPVLRDRDGRRAARAVPRLARHHVSPRRSR